MKVTLLDTVTGKTAEVSDDSSEFYWSDGNGSCDCNRCLAFDGVDDELDAAMRVAHPELESWQSYCYGEKRFLVIAADCANFDFRMMNQGYSDDLIQKYIGIAGGINA